MKGDKPSGSCLNAWYLRPLQWLFFIFWAAVLSFIKLFRDFAEKHKKPPHRTK